MIDVCDKIVKSLEGGGKGKTVYLYGNREAPGKIIEAVKERLGERVHVEVKPISENATAIVFTTL